MDFGIEIGPTNGVSSVLDVIKSHLVSGYEVEKKDNNNKK